MSFQEFLVEELNDEKKKIFDVDTLDVETIKKAINAPYVMVQVSTLGGKENAAIIIKLSLDPKESWNNNIYHNSRYAMFDLSNTGVLERFSDHLKNKFRKSSVKSIEDAVKKINDSLGLES